MSMKYHSPHIATQPLYPLRPPSSTSGVTLGSCSSKITHTDLWRCGRCVVHRPDTRWPGESAGAAEVASADDASRPRACDLDFRDGLSSPVRWEPGDRQREPVALAWPLGGRLVVSPPAVRQAAPVATVAQHQRYWSEWDS